MTDSARHIVYEIYSDVMFELAEETGQLEAVLEDLHEVSKILLKESEFLTLLISPKVKEKEKVGMIRRVFNGRVAPLTMDFLSVLARRNRMSFIQGITGRYEDLYDSIRNRKRIVVTFAKEPTTEQIAKLKEDLKDAISAEVKLTIKVEPEILGGIIIRKGDTMIDNSVKNILDRTVNVIMDHSRDKIEKNKNKSQD